MALFMIQHTFTQERLEQNTLVLINLVISNNAFIFFNGIQIKL